MRIYTKLECGCLISCDGGGGLIPCTYDEVNPNCKQEAVHKLPDGTCSVCGMLTCDYFVGSS